jgi:hypothetical protein
VGTFVSLDLVIDALSWGSQNRGVAGAYLVAQDLLLLLGGIALVLAAFWWNIRLDRANHRARTARRSLRFTSIAISIILLLVLIIPWMARSPTTPYHRSVVVWALWPASGWQLPQTAEFLKLPTGELAQRYREFTDSPPPLRYPNYWAKMRAADVIFLVFETGPAKCLPVEDEWNDFPNLRRLRERSFVGLQHFSTAPVTNRALFSLFGSLYPSSYEFGVAGRYPGAVLPGIMPSLAARGYETAAYTPESQQQDTLGDYELLESLGFRQLRWPDEVSADGGNAFEDLPDWEQRAIRDKGALSLLKQDIARWIRSDQRFAVVFLPEVGHAPWPDVTGGRARSLLERGRAIMALQDVWLGELLQELERLDRLDRTVIIITADHGVRTQKEDPDFRIGAIDEYSFHVPLLIYAPQLLDSTVRISWITSHIDVTPTVLDLLGVETGRDLEQGSTIWNDGLRNRTTFYLGSFYLGSDALSRDGQFYMYSHMTDSVCQSDALRFDPNRPVAPDSKIYSDVVGTLGRFNALQAAWMAGVAGRQTGGGH